MDIASVRENFPYLEIYYTNGQEILIDWSESKFNQLKEYIKNKN